MTQQTLETKSNRPDAFSLLVYCGLVALLALQVMVFLWFE
jgi:hypothetical protein